MSDEPTPPAGGGGGGISELQIQEEMRESYLQYSLSVITARALPDVRDGFKPSQRRVIVAMNDLNLGPGAKFRKCAKIVGDTNGNYHPHGDQAIYPTLTRMGQEWVMRYPLVSPQGNFGNPAGDKPAAMRYTECRMSKVAVAMLRDLENETVDTQANYDDTRQEPVVLPGKFPNLLCNGTQGIAVGMATSIPPHNLGEIAGGIKALIDMELLAAEPREITAVELMAHVKGPDFPTGAQILGRAGILQAYETGRGKVTLRAKAKIEEEGRSQRIVVEEIPYHLTIDSLMAEIANLAKTDRVSGIRAVNNDTDRKQQIPSLRIAIDLRSDANPEVVLNSLFRHSQLQRTFSINMMAVHQVHGKPQPVTCSLRQLMRYWVDHREEVIRRRTEYLLRAAEARAHIVEGLLKALDIIDEIIKLIRGSRTTEQAHAGLVEQFEFSTIQATHILRMPLSRLTGMEREKLAEELAELEAKIADYTDILARAERRYTMIKDDLDELVTDFGDERRTEIAEGSADVEDESLIVDEPVVLTRTHGDYIKRTRMSEYRTQGRGGKGVSGANIKDGDWVEEMCVATNHQYALLFTNQGRLHWKKCWQIPEGSRNSRGRMARNLVSLDEDERILSVIPVREFSEDEFLVFVTRKGKVKKTPLSDYSNVRTVGLRAIRLEEGDTLIRVRACVPGQELLIGTREGMSIRFNSDDARPMGRVAAGVNGIRLDREDEVVDMAVVSDDMTLLTATERGYGKRSEFTAYRLQGRGGRGVINLKTTDKTGKVIGLMAVAESDELMMITRNGQTVRTRCESLRIIGRGTQGVRLINVKDDDQLVAVARLDESLQEDEDESAAGETIDAEDTSGQDPAADDATPDEDGADE